MCELLGVSSLHSVTLEMSFQSLMHRAKIANPDGWGAVFYEQNDAYVFREPRPATLGPANFLYSDSRRLYAFASKRCHSDGLHPPGLYYNTRHCDQQQHSIPCVGLRIQTVSVVAQALTLIASVPLSDETWVPFEENQLLVIEKGEILNMK